MSIVQVYSLRNNYLEIQVLNVGATLISMKHLRDNINVVVRYHDLENYINDNGAYLGSSIGPCTGRMANSLLDTVQLVSNEANNSHLHGGSHGIHSAVFECVTHSNYLEFTATVDHSEDGYPGKVDYTITYALEGCELVVTHLAKPHKRQYINTTNHSYFNLIGSDSVLDHEFQINATQMSLVNEFGWYEGKNLSVEGTIFDFLEAKKLDQCVLGKHDQYEYTRSLDHFFHGNHLKLSLDHKVLDVKTDRLGFQVYTANYFDENFKVENGSLAQNFAAIALEPQSFNNEPNLGDYLQYDFDNPYKAQTRYKLYFNDEHSCSCECSAE